MALQHSPSIALTSITTCLDAGNPRSYSGSGTTWNSATGANNGTLVNGPTFTSGTNGYFTFDGIDDIMNTSLSITTTPALQPWSYEVWTQLTAWPTAVSPPNVYNNSTRSGVLLGATYYAGAALYWYGNSTGTACTMFAFLRGNDAYRSTGGYGMALNTWYQFVMVNDYPNAIRLYVNGTEYSNTGCATQEYNSGLIAGLTIGLALPQVDGGGEANYSRYPGRISIAKIYNSALSATQVSQNFNAIRGRYGI